MPLTRLTPGAWSGRRAGSFAGKTTTEAAEAAVFPLQPRWTWQTVDTGIKLPAFIALMNRRMKALENVLGYVYGQLVGFGEFADGDTTPSVAGANYWETANTAGTTITDFDDGSAGQTIVVKVDSNTTIAHNAAKIRLSGGVNFTGTAEDLITLTHGSDGIWREEARSVNG